MRVLFPPSAARGGIILAFLFFLVLISTSTNDNFPVTAATATETPGYDDTKDDITLPPPWFGAKPPGKKYRMQRIGWSKACATFCGGSERLGAVLPRDFVYGGDLTDLDPNGAAEILDAVRAHGMVVIKHQNLTRMEQVEFTSKLGPVIVLPSSFEGKDVEPGQPAIQRITNFWANDTWKGSSAAFGNYWHQDGQFWLAPKNNVLSVVHAQKVSADKRGQTGFADLRAARAGLSRPLLDLARNATIRASVRRIQDFRGGFEKDYAAFPESTHPILAYHSLDGGPMLYPGSPHMWVDGVGPEGEEDARSAGRRLLGLLFEHATSPSFTYYHNWEEGDVVVWDNTQTLHQAMPYDNNGINRREMYRTQCRFGDVPDDDYVWKPPSVQGTGHAEL